MYERQTGAGVLAGTLNAARGRVVHEPPSRRANSGDGYLGVRFFLGARQASSERELCSEHLQSAIAHETPYLTQVWQ